MKKIACLNKKNLILGLCFFLLVVMVTYISAIPQTISIHGKLTDANEIIISGKNNMTFRIYDSFTLGNKLWESINRSVTTDSDGIYNTVLSNINLTFNLSYYLGITVNADAEMSPRINMSSSSYSFRSNISDALDSSLSYTVNNLTANYVSGDGSKLTNINKSNFWDDFGIASDLNYLLLLSWSNITGRPTHLSNFTNDIQINSSNVTNPFWITISNNASIYADIALRANETKVNLKLNITEWTSSNTSVYLDIIALYNQKLNLTHFSSLNNSIYGDIALRANETKINLKLNISDLNNTITNVYDIIALRANETKVNLKVNKTGDTITGTLNASGQVIIARNITLDAGGKIMPYSDSTTAINIANSSGFDFTIFDTTNKRVGIGATPSATKLHVYSNTGTDNALFVEAGSSNVNPTLQITSAAGRSVRIDKTGGGETILYLVQNDVYNNPFLEGYGGGETPLLFKIDGNGKLLITTSTEVSGTDGHQIFLNDPATTAKGLKIGFDTTGDYGFINPVWEGTAYLDLVLAKVGGEVGIGMVPTAQFELSGSVGQKATGTTWSNPSDRRLKENIIPFTDGLNIITKINPVSYDLNGLGGTIKGTKGISVIAQDILSIAPYTIDTYKAKLNADDEEETELYRFEASALTFALINSVKEQQQQIETLKEKINNLTSRIETLERKQ